MGLIGQLSDSIVKNNPFSSPLVRTAHCSSHSSPTAALDGTVPFGSGKYFLLCGFGGILSCGTTHTAIVPLDLVKCRIQVNPEKYKGIGTGFKVSIAEDGMRGLARGK
jgi:solute carrier family 25 phosphate transporter 3